VVEDPESGELTDFMSFIFTHQTVLNWEEAGHGHATQTDATMFYYSFQKNTYKDMMKEAMYIARDTLKCDALYTNEMAGHNREILQDELKFRPNSTPLNWYMLNYSFGDRQVLNHDLNVVMI